MISRRVIIASILSISLGGYCTQAYALPMAVGYNSADSGYYHYDVGIPSYGGYQQTRSGLGATNTELASDGFDLARSQSNLYFPYVSSTVSSAISAPGTQFAAGGESDLLYFVEFSAPTNHTIATTTYYHLSVLAESFNLPNDELAKASIRIYQSYDSPLYYDPVQVNLGSNDYNSHADLTLETNTLYEVELYANVSSSNGGYASAFADPRFSFSQVDYPDVTLVLSPGAGNSTGPIATAVPEPATWGLMLAGFGTIGITLRRPKFLGFVATRAS